MDKYSVKLLSRAYQNLDGIYGYIALELSVPQTARQLIACLEEAIYSLEELPHRGAKRRAGAYSNRGYRQLFVKNFTIVYRIDEQLKQVVIVTVRYSRSQF